MRSGSKWPVIGPRPCAAYVDLVFTSQSYDISISTSTRTTNLSVFLVLIIMSTKLALPYTCACAYAYAYAYAQVKTMFNTSQILYRESLGGLSSVRTRTWRVVSSILTWSSEFFRNILVLEFFFFQKIFMSYIQIPFMLTSYWLRILSSIHIWFQCWVKIKLTLAGYKNGGCFECSSSAFLPL